MSGPFTISGSVDIYSPYGTKCDYTKPDITVDGVNKLGEWLYVPFQKTSFLVKAEDLGKFVAKTDQKQDGQTASAQANETAQAGNTNQNSGTAQVGNQNTNNTAQAGNNGSTQDTTPTQPEPTAPAEPAPGIPQFSTSPEPTPAPEPAPAPTPPAPVTTYSEAEVIAIYEGALRGAGMMKPEEVYPAELIAEFGPIGGMGWGIANIPMDNPHRFAASDAEAAQWQGFNLYYIENLGSSDGYVHLKVYAGRH